MVVSAFASECWPDTNVNPVMSIKKERRTFGTAFIVIAFWCKRGITYLEKQNNIGQGTYGVPRSSDQTTCSLSVKSPRCPSAIAWNVSLL